MITDQIYQLLQGSGRNQGPRGPETPNPSNSFIPQGMGAPGGNGLSELLRRQTAFRGFDLGLLLQLLSGGFGDGGDGGLGDGGNGGNGGGGNGGGGGCLAAETPVRMADGSEKRAADIKVDDLILGIDDHSGESIQVVTVTNSSRQPCFDVVLEGGDTITASATHKWYLHDGSVIHTTELEPGYVLHGEAGDGVVVTAVNNAGSQIVYWWNCAPNHCFFAGGLLHHNVTASQTKDPILVPGAGYQPPVVGGTGGAG